MSRPKLKSNEGISLEPDRLMAPRSGSPARVSPALSINTHLSPEASDIRSKGDDIGNLTRRKGESRRSSSCKSSGVDDPLHKPYSSYRKSRTESISDADEVARNLIRSLENENLRLASNPKAVLQTPVVPQPGYGQFSYADLLSPVYEPSTDRKERNFSEREIKWYETWLTRAKSSQACSSRQGKACTSTLLPGVPLLPHERQVKRETYFEMLEKVKFGIPPILRQSVWLQMCNTNSEPYGAHLLEFYATHVNSPSVHEKLIRKDVSRTLPNHSFFKAPEHQESLFRLLKVYSLYDAEVGYCQGLSFVAASLLAVELEERTAFQTFVDLMSPLKHLASLDNPLLASHGFRAQNNIVHGLRTLYTPEMSGLHSLLYIFNRLLAVLMPRVHDHLKTHQIPAHMYAGQWFLTLFSYSFSEAIVERLLDVIFACGARSTMLAFSLVVVKRLENDILLVNDFEKLAALLKSGHTQSWTGAEQRREGQEAVPPVPKSFDASWSGAEVDQIIAETADIQQYLCTADILQQLEQEWYVEKNKSLEAQAHDLSESMSLARQQSLLKEELSTQLKKEARTLAADLEELQERYKTVFKSNEALRAKTRDMYKLLSPERQRMVKTFVKRGLAGKDSRQVNTTEDDAKDAIESASDSSQSSLFAKDLEDSQSTASVDFKSGAPAVSAGSNIEPLQPVGGVSRTRSSHAEQTNRLELVLQEFFKQYTEMEKDLILTKLQLAELQQARDGVRNRLEHVNRQLSFMQQSLAQNGHQDYQAPFEQLQSVVKSAITFTSGSNPKSPLSRRSTSAMLELSEALMAAASTTSSNLDRKPGKSLSSRAASISQAVSLFIGTKGASAGDST